MAMLANLIGLADSEIELLNVTELCTSLFIWNNAKVDVDWTRLYFAAT